MNTAALIEKEERNRGAINLFEEGIFWKAYQRSAFLLVHQVAPGKVTKRPVKAVKQEVVSVCFPKDSLSKLFKEEQIERVSSKQIRIKGFDFNEEAYALWFASLPLHERKHPLIQRGISADDAQRVFYLLQNIRVEESTPIDCMHLLIKVQKILDSCI